MFVAVAPASRGKAGIPEQNKDFDALLPVRTPNGAFAIWVKFLASPMIFEKRD